MDLPLSSPLVPRLSWMPRAGSTNDVLVQAATGPSASAWPDLSVVATDDQVAGKGRLGRTWTAPAGGSLAVSVLLRPVGASGAPVPLERFGALPLLAGVAMAWAVEEALAGSVSADAAGVAASADAAVGAGSAGGSRVGLKWPNDVLVGEKKVSGILAELLPAVTAEVVAASPGADAAASGTHGVVIGAGVNLTLAAEQLPTPTSTSLQLEGAVDVSTDAVLASYLRALTDLYGRWRAHDGDAVASGLLAEVVAVSATLGRPVRVELPGGAVRTGVAQAIEADGRLVVAVTDAPPGSPSTLVVSAGDVTHLRHGA